MYVSHFSIDQRSVRRNSRYTAASIVSQSLSRINDDVPYLFRTPILSFCWLFGVMLGCLMPLLAQAQTKFDWPDSRYDISHYKYIDVCVAVRERVNDSTYARTEQWIDTLHYTAHNRSTPLHKSVVAATKKCLSPFSPDLISTSEFTRAQELYLVAGMDSEAKAIVDRRIRQIPGDSPLVLVRALDTTISVYMKAQPGRLQEALDLYEDIERLGSTVPILDRVDHISRLVNLSRSMQDSVNEARAFGKMLTLAKSMSDAEWTSIAGERLCMWIDFAIQSQYHDRFSKALASSTERFMALKGELFTSLVGRPNVFVYNDVENLGKLSPPVYGDYWFPAKPEGVVYPRSGVVTILFPVVSDDWRLRNLTLDRIAALHRLKARWPELEIIVIANTRGYFKEIEPPPPEVEAAYVDSMFRQFHDVPGILAVEKTKYWRMPGFDHRRIDEPTENAKYGRGMVGDNRLTKNGIGNYGMELIDKEGYVVSKSSLGGGALGEKIFERLIQVLIDREPKTRSDVRIWRWNL